MPSGRTTARTTTTYAVLGLLRFRPWTTYELARQVRRSSTGSGRGPSGSCTTSPSGSSPPAARSHESEGMVEVFFADAGDLDQLRTTLGRLEAEAAERLAALAELAAEAEGPFPERRHLGALCLRLQHDQERAGHDDSGSAVPGVT